MIYGMCFESMKVFYNAKNAKNVSPPVQSTSPVIAGNRYQTSLEWIPM